MGINRNTGRIIAIGCAVLIALLQVVFVMPSFTHAAATAGEQLEVRVQYDAEPGDKIRTKTVFNNSELEAIGAHNKRFSNITRVGTIMHSAAYCVELDKIIAAAGIDLGSVKSFTFRATDGYTITFLGNDYIGASGWYYPELCRHAHRFDTGGYEDAVRLDKGALDGGTDDSRPSLALTSYSLKGSTLDPSYDKMSDGTSYRFFTGQTDLSYLRYEDEEGNEAFDLTTENDITAWDSIKYVYGLDVVLWGSPALDGISLSIASSDIKVGSKKQIQVTFEGADADIFNASDVTWSSSDESIATVDANGVVTVKKAGEVIITAKVKGHSASVVLNGKAKDKSKDGNAGDKEKTADGKSVVKKNTGIKPLTNKKTSGSNKPEESRKQIIMAREITLGEEIKPEPVEQTGAVQVSASDSQALEAVEQYDKRTVAASSAAALLACCGGAVFRIRRFRADMGLHKK